MSSSPVTVTYSQVDGLDIKLDIYLPAAASGSVPAVLFFHGGALIAGDRQDSLTPQWLIDETLNRGWLFLSADYRLLLPYTSHDQITDLVALSSFLSSPFLASVLPDTLSLDTSRIALAGVSAGFYIGVQYALHAGPKPRAILGICPWGGSFLSDHHVRPQPAGLAFLGPAVPRAAAAAHLDGRAKPTAASPFSFGTAGVETPDGRGTLFQYLTQEGTLLDVISGRQGLGATLAALPTVEARAGALTEKERVLFPELLRVQELPPTFIIHGDKDSVSLVGDVEAFATQLEDAGVKTEVIVISGAEHGLVEAQTLQSEAVGTAEAYKKAAEFLENRLIAT